MEIDEVPVDATAQHIRALVEQSRDAVTKVNPMARAQVEAVTAPLMSALMLVADVLDEEGF